MSSHDIGDGAGTASAKASSGSASDLPPPSERGELRERLRRLRSVHVEGSDYRAIVDEAEAQITRLEGERDEARKSAGELDVRLFLTRGRLLTAKSKSARLSALLDQAREVEGLPEVVLYDPRAAAAWEAMQPHDRMIIGLAIHRACSDFLTRLSKTGGEEKQELSPSRTSPSSPDSRRPEALSDLEGELLAALKALLADSYPVGCDENMEVREQAIAAIAKAEHQQ